MKYLTYSEKGDRSAHEKKKQVNIFIKVQYKVKSIIPCNYQ